MAGIDFFRKCLELEEQYNSKHLKINHAIQTNGYELDEEWCAFLSQNHFLVGLSVDGVKATHDACRRDGSGQDTYLRVLHTAGLLKEAGADFNVLTVVNGKTAPKIRRIYEQYRKLGFSWQQYIACLDPVTQEQGRREYSLRPGVYGQFLIDLFELWEDDLKRGRQPYIRQFENYIGILMGYVPESCEQRGVCSVQNVVEADGSVYPCDFYAMDGYRLGNLNEEGFEAIERRRREIGFLENSRDHTARCVKCPYFAVCRGGCRRHRQQPGSVPGENRFCESYRMFFEACLPRMQKIARLCMRREGVIKWNI